MLLTSIITAITTMGVAYYTFPLARVSGQSMLPTYKEGNILITTRFLNRKKLKIGQVYVYRKYNEYGEEYFVIKRLTKLTNTVDGEYACFFEGDNPTESYDSRHYGYVKAENIIATVLWKIK